ncbi:MAG: DUF434 domain-containing protein [Eubacteriales bacterium]|nr:DUF434 domain-containing protein [Eubacteriales bacterium]
MTNRGYVPSDTKEFGTEIEMLRKASGEILYLLEAGYPVLSVVKFVGDHYQFSKRQRTAMTRSIATREKAGARLAKEIGPEDLKGRTVYIDGFNQIITLETAFSGNTLLEGMDGSIRDLAGLHGTYRLIDKTDLAIEGIKQALEDRGAAKAVFYLDKPVSNSGRLAGRIREIFNGCTVLCDARLIWNPDLTLVDIGTERDMTEDGSESGGDASSACVATSDSQVLDKCCCWYNLAKDVIEREIGDYPFVRVYRED